MLAELSIRDEMPKPLREQLEELGVTIYVNSSSKMRVTKSQMKSAIVGLITGKGRSRKMMLTPNGWAAFERPSGPSKEFGTEGHIDVCRNHGNRQR
jgi:hypothetical protein